MKALVFHNRGKGKRIIHKIIIFDGKTQLNYGTREHKAKRAPRKCLS